MYNAYYILYALLIVCFLLKRRVFSLRMRIWNLHPESYVRLLHKLSISALKLLYLLIFSRIVKLKIFQPFADYMSI